MSQKLIVFQKSKIMFYKKIKPIDYIMITNIHTSKIKKNDLDYRNYQ